jgi:hypothetical protein
MLNPSSVDIQTRPAPAGERGAALILALLVALVLVFLGMGLLLQTSLGLQASGTDRWITKALYAADAGALMQIELITENALSAPSRTLILEDDPSLPGLLKGQFTVNITKFCETQPGWGISGSQFDPDNGFIQREFHLQSVAERNVGDLAGLTRATVEADVNYQPYPEVGFTTVGFCY